MNKTTVIHQPDFLPYLGFFHRLLYADLFIILDDVQFLRRGWHHRDKIKTFSGDNWLTVGVKKSSQDSKINEIVLNDNNWKKEHLIMFEQYYKKTEFYEQIMPFLNELYSKEYKKMIDFNLASIYMLLKLFDINIKIEFSSTYDISSKSNALLVDLLVSTKSSRYLSGIGAKEYFQKDIFEKAHIEVLWQDFDHPKYQQINGEFIPYLSSIDLLFNCGILNSRKILREIKG